MSASRTPEQKIAETTAGTKAAAVVAIIVQLGGVQLLAVSGGGTGATLLFLASTAVLVAILGWLLVDLVHGRSRPAGWREPLLWLGTVVLSAWHAALTSDEGPLIIGVALYLPVWVTLSHYRTLRLENLPWAADPPRHRRMWLLFVPAHAALGYVVMAGLGLNLDSDTIRQTAAPLAAAIGVAGYLSRPGQWSDSVVIRSRVALTALSCMTGLVLVTVLDVAAQPSAYSIHFGWLAPALAAVLVLESLWYGYRGYLSRRDRERESPETR